MFKHVAQQKSLIKKNKKCVFAGFPSEHFRENVHLMQRANKDVSLIRFCSVMLLILSKYSSEKNLIDDEGTIIQTLTFSLNAAMQKRERG